MKLLLDQNISYRLVKDMNFIVPTLNHVKFVGLSDAEDYEIWEYAKQNEYTIVTFDADFYEIQNMRGSPPKLFWLRFGNTTRREFMDFFVQNIETIREFCDAEEPDTFNCLEFNSI